MKAKRHRPIDSKARLKERCIGLGISSSRIRNSSQRFYCDNSKLGMLPTTIRLISLPKRIELGNQSTTTANKRIKSIPVRESNHN